MEFLQEDQKREADKIAEQLVLEEALEKERQTRKQQKKSSKKKKNNSRYAADEAQLQDGRSKHSTICHTGAHSTTFHITIRIVS